jgi:hypothetical protein
MSTGHAGESLDEALWFALNVTSPSEEYESTCGSFVAITVANAEWDAQVQRRLSDLRRLDAALFGSGE